MVAQLNIMSAAAPMPRIPPPPRFAALIIATPNQMSALAAPSTASTFSAFVMSSFTRGATPRAAGTLRRRDHFAEAEAVIRCCVVIAARMCCSHAAVEKNQLPSTP